MSIRVAKTCRTRRNPTSVRIESEYEFRRVSALRGLLPGDRTLTTVSEFAMRNEWTGSSSNEE